LDATHGTRLDGSDVEEFPSTNTLRIYDDEKGKKLETTTGPQTKRYLLLCDFRHQRHYI
jgi:hypothetical protein